MNGIVWSLVATAFGGGLVTHDAMFIDETSLAWTSRGWGVPSDEHPLAYPLPAATVALPPSEEAQLERDARGRVVAVRGGVVSLRVPQREGRLTAPLWQTHHVQRIDVDGAQFVPASSSGLTKTVTGWLGPGIDRKRRREADRRAKLRARASDPAIHVVLTPTITKAKGIPGTLRTQDDVVRWLWPLLALLAGVCGVGGWVLFRSLRQPARAEQNQAYIDAEFDR